MTYPKKYRLYLQPYIKLMVFGAFGIMTIIGLLMLLGVFQSAQGDGPPRIVGLILLALAGWNWYYLIFTIPYAITVAENGHIEVISLLSRKRIAANDILSIKPYSQLGFLVIRTTAGKIRILNQFDEFHDFILTIKTMKPGIELRGC